MTEAGTPRVVTFGELLLRLSPPDEERLLASPELRTFWGGAEANVAVGLSHLGVRCDYVTRVPANPIGDAGIEALRREGVGTEWIQRGGGGAGERMGLYFVEPGHDLRTMRVVYDRAGSAFARLDPATLNWSSVLAGAEHFHGSGITPALGEGPATALADAVACARAQGTLVSLDLNYREALWRGRDPRPVIEPLARGVDVLIGNAAAVRAMLGVAAEQECEVARRIVDSCGCRVVALTSREVLGARQHAWSAVIFDAATGSLLRSRRHVVRVVDRVGGGDGFAAGLIAALVTRRAPAETLEFAVAAGALKLTIPGDFCRVSAAEVERVLQS